MSTISKKRKRAAEDESGQVTIKVAQPNTKTAGPVLGAHVNNSNHTLYG